MDDWTKWRPLVLAREIALGGVGVHGGDMATVRVFPAPREEGITLVRTDVENGAFGRLRADMVRPQSMATVLENDHGVRVSTIEHLMAALAGLGIVAARIEIEGSEFPILDGSARPWVEAMMDAGVEVLAGEKPWLPVREEVVVEDGAVRLEAFPDGEALFLRVVFGHDEIGTQMWEGVVTPDVFINEISGARSFITEKELARARAAGLVKGADMKSGVLFRGGQAVNPEGLRFEDEPVRHKVLDVLGDLYLQGMLPAGRLVLRRGGHAANNRLLRLICGLDLPR